MRFFGVQWSLFHFFSLALLAYRPLVFQWKEPRIISFWCYCSIINTILIYIYFAHVSKDYCSWHKPHAICFFGKISWTCSKFVSKYVSFSIFPFFQFSFRLEINSRIHIVIFPSGSKKVVT